MGIAHPGRAPRTTFRLARDGSITAPGGAVSRCGRGWVWEAARPASPACGAARSLGAALDACALALSPGGRWILALPAGDLLLVRPGADAGEALEARGFALASGAVAFLALEMPPGATEAEAAAEVRARLSAAEVPGLRAVVAFDRDTGASHWCADLALDVAGYVEPDALGDLASDVLSPGAAALLIGAEARLAEAEGSGAAPPEAAAAGG